MPKIPKSSSLYKLFDLRIIYNLITKLSFVNPKPKIYFSLINCLILQF